MKKFGVILVLMVVITSFHEASAQIFGAKAGLNLSSAEFDTDADLKMKPGFHIGPTVEFPASENFAVETGLLLSGKGVKISVEDEGDLNLNLMYLDLPVTGKVYFDAGGARIFGQLGPYAGFGLTGKWKMDEFDEDIEWGSDGDFKRLDFGLLAGAGIDINNLQIGVNYSLGLANISSDGDEDIRNRVLAVSVGYRFSGN